MSEMRVTCVGPFPAPCDKARSSCRKARRRASGHRRVNANIASDDEIRGSDALRLSTMARPEGGGACDSMRGPCFRSMDAGSFAGKESELIFVATSSASEFSRV